MKITKQNPKQRIPDGHIPMPTEPTKEMTLAFIVAASERYSPMSAATFRECYRAVVEVIQKGEGSDN